MNREIINCIGSKSAALREVCPVLKPGGLFVSLNGSITKESMTALLEHTRKVLLREYPDAFDSLYEDTVLAGFRKIDSVVQGVWYNSCGPGSSRAAKGIHFSKYRTVRWTG